MINKLKLFNAKKIIIVLILIILITSILTGILVSFRENKSIQLEMEKEKLEEYSSSNPYIPAGFEHIAGTVDNGFVVKDLENENEFVWVPVDRERIKLERNNFANTVVEKSECVDNLDEVFKTSVYTYGGFYIARYEAGFSDTAIYDDTEGGKDISETPVSKKNSPIWNNISYEKAEGNCLGMYSWSPEITSSIMSSYAWDATVMWLGDNGYHIDTDNSTYGNYANNEFATGEAQASGNQNTWIMNNIYDLAGNLSEWTTEKVEATGNRVVRGGNYLNNGNVAPVANRDSANEKTTSTTIGYRPMIYKTGASIVSKYNEPYLPTGFEYVSGQWSTGYIIRDQTTRK